MDNSHHRWSVGDLLGDRPEVYRGLYSIVAEHWHGAGNCDESLVAKHCHEVNLANLGIAQGALLGLVADTRLEITHCFPFPSVSDESIRYHSYIT